MKKIRKRIIVLRVFAVAVCLFVLFALWCVYFRPALPGNRRVIEYARTEVDTDFYRADNSWLLKNRYGLWEMYVEGDGVERGSKIGVLSQELIVEQEDAFVEQIQKMLPSKLLTHFLRLGVGIYNRNIGKYIPEENREEIYAISRYASSDYSWIGNNYQRIMNYHSAHDIGHAVQLAGFAGCSALGIRGSKTPDNRLLIGRNFDFYVGDRFAENKILMFVNPAKGYKHASVTWGGMIGVVSGMNEKGLTVVLNAAPSNIPFSSATPVSILAREILQYAKNIPEAVAIAQKRKTFISEQFIVGSAEDDTMISIEKTKNGQIVVSPEGERMVFTNHFLGDELANADADIEISEYRMCRMKELCDSIPVFTPEKMVDFLRDKKGINGKDIGLHNEKSIDQLIAHHSIVFHPSSKTLWLSTEPFQEGVFLAYCLDSVFNNANNPRPSGFSIDGKLIPADSVFINRIRSKTN